MIRELSLHQMLHVTDDTVLVTTLTGDEQTCRIEMRTQNTTSGWIKHATATVARETDVQPTQAPRPADDEVADELNPDDLYQRLRGAGQQHGTAFRGIIGLAVAEIRRRPRRRAATLIGQSRFPQFRACTR